MSLFQIGIYLTVLNFGLDILGDLFLAGKVNYIKRFPAKTLHEETVIVSTLFVVSILQAG